MADAAQTLKVTYAEYLAAERDTAVKHEFLDGVIYAMSGGTIEHSQIAANVIHALMGLLRDRPCVVYTSDARVRIESIDVATYPDVSVVCGPVVRAADDHDGITNPVLLIEVLSDSTELYDRGEKFGYCRRIPSVREYVMVSQHAKRVEVYQRTGARRWAYAEYEAGERMTLASIDGDLTVDEIYSKVAITETAGAQP